MVLLPCSSIKVANFGGSRTLQNLPEATAFALARCRVGPPVRMAARRYPYAECPEQGTPHLSGL